MDRCYFCKTIFDQPAEVGAPQAYICNACPFPVSHLRDPINGFFNWISISVLYKDKKYIFEFNPFYKNNLFILKGDSPADPNLSFIVELDRPYNFMPEMAPQYLDRILKMKAFL